MEMNEKLKNVVGRILDSVTTLSEVKGFKEYSLFHFFLHLRHENIIKRGASMPSLENASNIINWFLHKKESKIDPIFEDLFEEFKQDCERIDSVTFTNIWQKLNLVTDEEFNNCYSEIIDLFLIVTNAFSNTKDHTYEFQSIEVTKLVLKLCPISESMTVYNPFAGLASYALEMGNLNFYFGQEVNSRIWALGIIRLKAYNLQVEHYEKADSIKSWKIGTCINTNEFEPFDLIVSTPPFGVIVNSQEIWAKPKPVKICTEEAFIFKGIEGLKPNGKLVGVFPINILNNVRSRDSIRKTIVESDILEAVIALPSSYEVHSSTSTIILLFSKNKQNKGFVMMIDATSFYSKDGNTKIPLYDGIYKLFSEKKEGEFVKFTPNSEIASNDYNLVPSRYTEEPLSLPGGYELVKLGELISQYRSTSHKESLCKYVAFKHLATSPIDSILDLNKLNLREIKKQDQIITSEVLLLANYSSNIKPTICSASEADPIFCAQSITPFTIFNDLIDSAYLIYELNSDYVKRQIRKLSTGIVMPYISIRDILSIKIQLPKLELQKAVVEGARNATLLAHAKEMGLEKVIQRMKQDYIEDVRIKKHALSQYHNNIHSSILALSNFISIKGYGNELISERRGISLHEHINKLVDASGTMGMLLNQLTKEDKFGEPQIINIKNFISEYILKYSHQTFDVEYSLDWNSFVDMNQDQQSNDQNEELEIHANSQDLTEVFDNIFDNAIKHGFTDVNRKDYMIQIILGYDFYSYKISFCNNGNPLPSGMDTKRYSIKGEKAGKTGNEGIGGYRVKAIVEHYGGDIKILTDNLSLCPVTVEISLPIYKSDE